MRQKFSIIVVCVSLLLFGIILAADVLSWFRTDFIYFGQQSGRVFGIDSGSSWIGFTIDHANPTFLEKGFTHTVDPTTSKPVFTNATNEWQRLGFWSIDLRTSSSVGHRWVVPYWSLLLICLLPTASKLLSWIRSRRLTKSGCCTVCGYDLRATPERCPECGAAPNLPHNQPMHRTGPAV